MTSTEVRQPNSRARRRFLMAAGGAGVAAAFMHNASAASARTRLAARGIEKANKAGILKGNSEVPLSVVVMNRMAFGPRLGSSAAVNDLIYWDSLGNNDEQRLTAYIEAQLNPSSLDDLEVDNLILAGGYETLDKPLHELWYTHKVQGQDRYRPLEETQRTVFLRGVYSRRQFTEVLADFWHNHFNMYGRDDYARYVWSHLDKEIIRGRMFGNFRSMLAGVAKHASMLYYLDNYTNTAAGPNENFARELFELHTLGSENYFGLIEQDEVPEDEFGQPLGYVDDDIYEATRAFTGWTVANGYGNRDDTGLFYYEADDHDRFQKYVLKTRLDNDQPPLKDGEDVLDMVAYHRGTGRYIARKLCTRLISDNPPQSLIDEAAEVFHSNRFAPDQLEQVYRTILYSDAFKDKSTFRSKMKRPFEVLVSAMRAGGADFRLRWDHGETWNFLYRFDRTGQMPFLWPTPDGYPDYRSHWQSSQAMVQTWRVCDWLNHEHDDDLNDKRIMPIIDITNAITQSNTDEHTPEKLANLWMIRLLAYAPPGGWYGDPVHTAATDFFRHPTSDELPPWPADFPISMEGDLTDQDNNNRYPYYWHDRLRGMVSLIMASPYFMQR